jgi:hypothetical protein
MKEEEDRMAEIEIRRALSSRKFRMIWILAVLCIVSPGSLTQLQADQNPPPGVETCEAPVWQEGDSWRFMLDNKKFMEVKLNKETIEKRYMDKFVIPFAGLKIFPLWEGKNYRDLIRAHFVNTVDRNFEYHYRVIGIRNVKVPAGTFKCYEIRLQMRCEILHLFASATIYYSPETRCVIKTEGFQGLSVRMQSVEILNDYELASLTLSDRGSPGTVQKEGAQREVMETSDGSTK